jgi:hypothetical protein
MSFTQSLNQSQWMQPNRSVQILNYVFNNMGSFYLNSKTYNINNGKKMSSDHEISGLTDKITMCYWVYYSHSNDRLYTLAFLNTGEYVYVKVKGVSYRSGGPKKMRLYFCTNYEELLHTALTASEHEKYHRFVSHV